MATAVEQPQMPQELRTSAPESLPKSAIPAAVASPVPAPAATETVSLRAEEVPAPAQETKAPVVAEAHLVDTYRKFAQPTLPVVGAASLTFSLDPPQRMFASMSIAPLCFLLRQNYSPQCLPLDPAVWFFAYS